MKKAIAIILSIILIMAITLPVNAISIITVKSIKLNYSKVTLKVGQSSNLKTTFTPANTSQKMLTYVTDNKLIADVDAKGKITGVAEGTATITVYTQNKGVFAACSITVQKKPRIKFVYAQQDRAAKAPGDAEVLKYINDKFNCDYQRMDIPAAQINDKMSILIASGAQIDAYYGALNAPGNPRDVYMLKYGMKIQPLNNLLKENGKTLLKEIPQDSWQYASDTSGKIWFVPDVGFKSKIFLFARQDWMDKLKIQTPKTIDDFEKMLVAMRDGDPDGNGKNDTYPLAATGPTAGTAMPNYFDASFLGSFLPNGSSWFEDNDGNLVPPFMHPNYKLYLQTLQRWYKEKLIHPDYLVMKLDQLKDAMVKGVSGLQPNWYTLSYQDEIKTVNPNAKVTYIPLPVGPSGKSGALSQAIVGGGLVISARAKPEVAAKIIEIADWLQTPEGTNFAWYGIEGKHWVKQGDKITPAPGIDPASPAYKAQLYINGANAWKYYSESSLVRPELTSITRQAAIKGQYPTIDPVDFQFMYNWNGTQTRDLITDLDTKMPIDMYMKIVSGEKPVSYLDDFIKEWKSKGGDTYIKEKTAMYKKQKK